MPDSTTMKVIVTGASGVLGTAVYDAFKAAGYDTLGLAHSRPTGDLKTLDLLDTEATEELLTVFKPSCTMFPIISTVSYILSDDMSLIGVVHCAAERRPDVAEKVCRNPRASAGDW